MEERIKEIELTMLKSEETLKQSMCNTMEELDHLKKDKELFNMETEVLKKSVEDNIWQNNLLREEVKGLKILKKELETQKQDLNDQVESLENKLMSCK